MTYGERNASVSVQLAPAASEAADVHEQPSREDWVSAVSGISCNLKHAPASKVKVKVVPVLNQVLRHKNVWGMDV
jgi:hypothetical protein